MFSWTYLFTDSSLLISIYVIYVLGIRLTLPLNLFFLVIQCYKAAKSKSSIFIILALQFMYLYKSYPLPHEISVTDPPLLIKLRIRLFFIAFRY